MRRAEQGNVAAGETIPVYRSGVGRVGCLSYWWLRLKHGVRGSLFVSLIFGLLVGEAVRRGARGNRGPAFMAIAAVTTLIGLLAAGYGFNPMGFVFALIIAGIAAYRLSE